MKLQRVAAAMPFAQLLGLAKRAEDDDETRRARRAEEDDDEDQDKKARRAEEDSDDDAAKSKRAKSEDSDDSAEDDEAEDGDDDQDEEEDGDDGDEEGKKSRKAKSKSKGQRAEDDEEGEDGDDEGRKAKSARGAVRRERARCAAIIAHGVAIGSVRQACVLAFDTSMGVKAAKASLNACKADGSSPRGGLADRMAAAAVPTVGADSAQSSAPGLTKTAAAIIAIGEKVRGEPARK